MSVSVSCSLSHKNAQERCEDSTVPSCVAERVSVHLSDTYLSSIFWMPQCSSFPHPSHDVFWCFSEGRDCRSAGSE